MDWRATSQPVGWVERSETHHPATRTPPRKAVGFAFGSTHPTAGLAGVLAARRMGRAQRTPSSRDPAPAAQSDGCRLWLYPSYGLASGAQEFVERVDALEQARGRRRSRDRENGE